MKKVYALQPAANPPTWEGWLFFTNLKKAVLAAGFTEKRQYQTIYRRMKKAADGVVTYDDRHFVCFPVF